MSNGLAAARIKAFGATHLIPAVNPPKSESRTCRPAAELDDVNVLGIGTAVEFASALKLRSPRWTRLAELKLLWRLGVESRRLFKRYFTDFFAFVRAIAADRKRSGPSVT